MSMDLSKKELLSICDDLKIKNCKSKNKSELLELINSNDLSTSDNIENLKKSLMKKLSSYNPKIMTKLKNINKASVDTSIACSTKRVSQNSRIYIPYSVVKQNKLKLKHLNTYKKGICIGLDWKTYSKIKDKEKKTKLEEYLFNNIGSDNVVSCIIVIMKDNGYSGSSKQREDKLELDKEIIENNWISIKRKDAKFKNVNEGNDKWEGHYYYNIKGGEHENFKSWEGNEPQIFTTYKGFMESNKVILSIYISLLYMLLHVKDIDKVLNCEELSNYKTKFEKYLKETKYLDKSCYDLIFELKCINKDNNLISPILCEEISIDDFCEEGKINISHNIPVCKNIILFCNTNKILLSDYRIGNLFWDYKIGNMRQQNNTIDEYWKSIEKSLELRKLL